jgi:hypothetical protein
VEIPNKEQLHYAIIQFIKWGVGNVIFGLLPLFAMILMKFSTSPTEPSKSKFENELEGLLKSGIVSFFLCALMGSLTIDFIIEKKKFHKLFWFAALRAPFIVLIVLSVGYIMLIYGKFHDNQIIHYQIIPYLSIIYSLCYCFIAKMSSFIRHE